MYILSLTKFYNNIILRKNTVMELNYSIQGTVEKIAPGEIIYSARFLGDRAYWVTYKNMDPFLLLT